MSVFPRTPHQTHSVSMDASRLVRPPSTLLSRSFGRPAHRRVGFFGQRRPRLRVLAGSRSDEGPPLEGDPGGGSVEEGMATLWKRMEELREEEKQQQHQGKELIPVDLSRLQREEDTYMLYKSGMLEVVGLLQLHPEGERTKVDVGVTVTVKLLVPTTVLVVMLHLMDAAKVILDGMQHK